MSAQATDPTQTIPAAKLAETVRRIVFETPVVDMHTHLYAEAFAEHLLWGIDELLHYHYLTAELFRHTELSYDEYWALAPSARAEAVWQTLFVDRSPVSEAASGVLTALNRLGLSPAEHGTDLNAYREAWRGKPVSRHVDDVLAAAGVETVVMTNDPFDAKERAVWDAGAGKSDARFLAALRIDKLLLDWPAAAEELRAQGYAAADDPAEPASLGEVRRFLRDWQRRMDALYIMASLPGGIAAEPAADAAGPERAFAALLHGAVAPVCLELGIPLALMVGVRRQANPQLRLAGDMSMRSDLGLLEGLARRYGRLELLVTVLARENQHELAVLSRKFRNLTLFGCWWFLHTDSMIRELTKFRVELLGTGFIPQHSDCRVLEQLVNKWEYSRGILADVLADKYGRLAAQGWPVTEAAVRRDAAEYFGGTFRRVLGRAKKNQGGGQP